MAGLRSPSNLAYIQTTATKKAPVAKAKVRFAADARQGREPSPSGRSSADETFERALGVLDHIVQKDEQRNAGKMRMAASPTRTAASPMRVAASPTRVTSGREDPPQFALAESQEMNRILTEQLRMLQRKVNRMGKDGNAPPDQEVEVMAKRYNTMKKKLASVTGVLEEVTIANKTLLTKNEELKRRIRGNDAPSKREQTVYHQDQEELIATIRGLEEKVEDYREEKMSAKATQSRKDAKYKKLESSLADATYENSQLNAKNTALELELVATKDKLENAQEAFKQGEKEKQRLTNQISDLFSGLDQMTETNEKLASQISVEKTYKNEKSHQEEAQSNFTEDIRERKEALQEKVDQLKTRLGDAVKTAKKFEDMPHQVEEMKRKMDVQEVSHRSEIAVMQTEVSKLKTMNSALEIEVAGLNVRLDGAHKEINVTREARNELYEETRMKQQRRERAPTPEPMSDNQVLFSNMDDHMTDLERLNKRLENEKDTIQQRYLKCCAEYDEVNEANRKLATKNKDLMEANLELEKEATHSKGTVNGKAAMVSALARKIEELQYQRTELMDERTTLETQITVEKNAMVMANTNISELEVRIATYESEVAGLNIEIQELNEENERLQQFESQTHEKREELKEKRQTIESLEAKIEELENEKSSMEEKMKQAEGEVEAHKNTIAASSKQVADLGGSNALQESKIAELEEKLEASKLELTAMQKTHEEFIESQKKSYDEKVATWEGKVASVNSEWQETMDDVINEWQIKYDDSSDQWQAKFDTVLEESEAKLKDLNEEWQTKYDFTAKENTLLTEKCANMKNVYDTKNRANDVWEELQGKLDQSEANLVQAKEDNNELTATNIELEKQVNAQVEQIKRMNEYSVTAAKKQNERMTEVKERTMILQGKCVKLENANADLQAKHEASRTEAKSLSARYKCTAIEVEQMENQFTSLSKEIVSHGRNSSDAAMVSIVSALHKQVEQFKKERRQLYQSQATIEAKATVHRNAMVAATSQIAEIENEKEALQDQLRDLKVKLDDAKGEIETAHQSVAVTQSALNALGKIDAERQTKTDDLRELNADMTKKNTTLTLEQTELQAAHSELQSKYDTCCSELESLKVRVTTQDSVKRSSVAMASTQLAELSARNSSLERDLATAKEEVKEAHDEMESAREEMESSMSLYRRKLDAMTQLNVECQAKIYELEKTIEKNDYVADPTELKATMATCQQQLADQTQSNEVYKNLIDQLTKMNEDLKAQVNSHKDSLEAMKESEATMSAQEVKLSTMTEELATLTNENSDMKDTLKALTNKLTAVTKDRENARDEGKYLLKRIDDLSSAKDKVDKTLKDWKRVSKGKMRELSFRNTHLTSSNQEKANEIERLRNLISRRR
ncbi:MAG: hypothetical protein SGBAC_003861 [Bacillariaceae sp.]